MSVTVGMARGVQLILLLNVITCTRGRANDQTLQRSAAPPTVVLESPRKDAVIEWRKDIHIRAKVSNVSHPVVEFGVNNDVIYRDSTPPYEVVHRPRVHGQITVTAQVRDAKGNVIAGDAVTVKVREPNPANGELTLQDTIVGTLGPQPIVTMSAPADGARLARDSVQLKAEATGTAAGVVSVEFLIDGEVVGQRTVPTTEPTVILRFDHVWKPGVGTHIVAARAVDAEGRVATSKQVTVTVY